MNFGTSYALNTLLEKKTNCGVHSNRDYAFVNFVEIFVDMAFDVDVKNILKYDILSVGAGPVRFQLAVGV